MTTPVRSAADAFRVLMIAERFPPDVGGVARSAHRIAASLGRVPCDVHVVAWTKTLLPGQLETTTQTDGTTVHRIGLFGHLDMSLQHTMNVLEWLHGQHPFNAIWGHYLNPAGFMAVLTAGKFALPSIVSARGNDVDRMMFPPGDFARLRWTLEQATVVTAVSQELAGKISLLLANEKPVHLFRNVVDSEIFQDGIPDPQLRSDLGIAPTESILGFCGELRHKKGLPFLLNCLAEVRRKRPACLLVIGEVRARERSQLTAHLADLPDCQGRIRVTGQLDEAAEVVKYLNLCDVFLQPSVWDGLPNAVLEAMACRRVVIASDAGGIPEVIRHAENGFLLPRSQLHRLGQATLEVLDLPLQERRQIGRAARQRVLADFHPKQEVERLTTLLNEIV